MNCREYAYNALYRILYEHGYASLILRARTEYFNEADTALISQIIYGTLRNRTWLEYQWEDLAKQRVRPKLTVLLDMSIYQMQFLERVPDYAIIHEAVELADRHEKGFVNAILRKVSARGVRPYSCSDTTKELSLKTSHPLWILKMWEKHYGTLTMQKIAQEDQKPAVVYGRVNGLKMRAGDLEKCDGVHRLENECFTYDGILTDTEWFEKGQVLVQDRSSQQIPYRLDVQKGMRVLDACAAPGTKTQQIASLLGNDGEVVALELHEERTKLIDQLMKRTGVTIVKSRCQDASVDVPEFHESFDRVLVDAPCSGLGDLSHKPEIRWHLLPEDIDQLVLIQHAILDTCSAYVKDGGLMVYSTCTLNRKENEAQVARFLKEHEEFELVDEKTWFPFEMESDGFYAAQLRKKKQDMVE